MVVTAAMELTRLLHGNTVQLGQVQGAKHVMCVGVDSDRLDIDGYLAAGFDRITWPVTHSQKERQNRR